MNVKQKTDALTKYLDGPKVKGRLVELIKEYNEQKENPTQLMDVKDGFIQLGFYLTELTGKAKDVYNEAQMESQNTYNKSYLESRGEVGEDGKRISVETCKYRARLKTSDAYLTEYAAEINYTLARGWRDDCKNYVNAAIQRLSYMKEDIFNSRQQV